MKIEIKSWFTKTRGLAARHQRVVGALGVICTVAGFMVSRADHFDLAARLLSPHYPAAQSGLAALDNDGALRRGDRGFWEVCQLIAPHLNRAGTNHALDDADIARIVELDGTGGGGWAVVSVPGEGMSNKQTLSIKIVLDGAPALTGTFYDLRLEARRRFSDERLFVAASAVFWFGLVFTIVRLLA